MKKPLIFFASILLMASHANAEVYKTNFIAPDNRGLPYNASFNVDLIFAENGAISGEIKFFNSTICRWAGQKVTGGNFKDDNFRWETELHPIKGCGKIIFVGKKEGQKIVGYLPSFQGVRIDIELITDAINNIKTTPATVFPTPPRQDTTNSPSKNIQDRLQNLKDLYDKKLITEDDYDKKRKDILNSL